MHLNWLVRLCLNWVLLSKIIVSICWIISKFQVRLDVRHLEKLES